MHAWLACFLMTPSVSKITVYSISKDYVIEYGAKKNLPPPTVHFVHDKSHMGSPAIEPTRWRGRPASKHHSQKYQP